MTILAPLGLLVLLVVALFGFVLWSGGERPSWTENDEPDHEHDRRARAKDRDDGDDD